MHITPRSKEFDDVYFSEKDGLAETRHVFIAGNHLPGRWADARQFTIFETGFGTGLNFLAAWRLFQETKAPEGRLHFISVEKFPLGAGQIKEYLSGWEELGSELEILCGKYPDIDPSAARLRRFASAVALRAMADRQDNTVFVLEMDDAVTLTLIFGDVNDALPKLQQKIDCWFLDGFKPASNPEMWTDVVFQNMARLSNPGATFATFTAAGVVKRGLKEAGFTVEKVQGFGWKRDMLRGKYKIEK